MSAVIPPCAGKWLLFDSTDAADHIEAARLCGACPMRTECEQRLESARNRSHRPIGDYGPVGTWAGHLVGAGPRISVDRARAEEAMFTDSELRTAHAQYSRGSRDPNVVIGERIYQRRKKREQYSRRTAA